jgi:hypothetical protein
VSRRNNERRRGGAVSCAIAADSGLEFGRLIAAHGRSTLPTAATPPLDVLQSGVLGSNRVKPPRVSSCLIEISGVNYLGVRAKVIGANQPPTVQRPLPGVVLARVACRLAGEVRAN